MRIFLFSHWLLAFLWLAATVSQMIKYLFEFYRFSYIFKIILQDYVNLEIKKKSGLSLNPDIHHLKVPSSGLIFFVEPCTWLPRKIYGWSKLNCQKNSIFKISKNFVILILGFIILSKCGEEQLKLKLFRLRS